MMSIGELAARTGLSAATLRYYERERLLPPPARRAGRRVYGDEDVRRVRLVMAARGAGFGIAVIRELGAHHATGSRESEHFQTLIRENAMALDAQIGRLQTARALLGAAVACGCGDLLGCPQTPMHLGV